mgnify:CR=1 FL=1
MNILYHGWVRRNYEIADLMKKHYNWNPSVIAANLSEKEKTKSDFPNAKFVSIPDLRFGDRDFFGFKKIPITQEDFSKMSEYYTSYILSFQDTTLHNFSTRDKIFFSKKLFDYWNTLLINTKIDCVVFYTWPHTTTCLSLYLIAKYVFKKKILFVDLIEHFNKNYHTAGKDLEDLSKPYLKYINEKHEIEDVNEYIKNVKTEKNFLRDDHKRFRKDYVEKYHIIKLLLKLCKSLFTLGFLRKAHQYYKSNYKSWNKKNSISHLSWVIFRIKIAVKLIFIRRFYQKKSQEINSKNYILFSSQYQPENNSIQLAGYFQDFFAVLDLIYSCKDENVDVYYKEHPDSFENINVYVSPLYKDKKFWNKLMKYKNLKLVNYNKKFLECVKDAQAVVTLSSTSGLESLIHGKPVLLFSRSWYTSCNGAFLIKSYNDCKTAMEKIKNGFKPNPQKVKNFLNSVALSCKKGILHDKEIKSSNEEHKISLKKIASLLNEKFNEYYQ